MPAIRGWRRPAPAMCSRDDRRAARRDALVTRDAAALAVALHSRLPEAIPDHGALLATDLIEAIPSRSRGPGFDEPAARARVGRGHARARREARLSCSKAAISSGLWGASAPARPSSRAPSARGSACRWRRSRARASPSSRPTPAAGFPLLHADLYRVGVMSTSSIATGFFDLLGAESAAIVEWIDLVPDAAPPEHLRVEREIAAPTRAARGHRAKVRAPRRCSRLVTGSASTLEAVQAHARVEGHALAVRELAPAPARRRARWRRSSSRTRLPSRSSPRVPGAATCSDLPKRSARSMSPSVAMKLATLGRGTSADRSRACRPPRAPAPGRRAEHVAARLAAKLGEEEQEAALAVGVALELAA